MIAVNSPTHPTKSSLVWIDEDDIIYEHLWPAQQGCSSMHYNDMSTTVPRLTHCQQDRIHLASSSSSSWHNNNKNRNNRSIRFDAWLQFENDTNSWSITYNWPPSQQILGSNNKTRNNNSKSSSTSLRNFLDNRDIFNLILSSNPNGSERTNGVSHCNPHMKGAQFIYTADWFGILLLSDSVLFVFGREEKGWKTVDLRSRSVETSGSIGEMVTLIDSFRITDTHTHIRGQKDIIKGVSMSYITNDVFLYESINILYPACLELITICTN